MKAEARRDENHTSRHGTRPRAPAIDGLTPFQELHGKVLGRIHAAHLRELDRVKQMVSLVEVGKRALSDLERAVETLPMLEAYRDFGTLCGRECKLLTFHHDAEEHGLFPALRGHAKRELLAVLERLAAEHVIIHEHIEALAEEARNLTADPRPDRFDRCREALLALDRLVRSHFRYEEGELAGPIGYYGVAI